MKWLKNICMLLLVSNFILTLGLADAVICNEIIVAMVKIGVDSWIIAFVTYNIILSAAILIVIMALNFASIERYLFKNNIKIKEKTNAIFLNDRYKNFRVSMKNNSEEKENEQG